MRFGSLFTGIGGIDLGLERAGMEGAWQVENDPYCVKVLEKHWPNVRRYDDIKEINWEEVEPVDLVCGGFPCQPISIAGKKLRQADDRWLWPEFARCLRILRPRLALLENVPGLLTGGMGDVLGDLSILGYDAEWDSLPASAFGAPHLRYRVFIVAYTQSPRTRMDFEDSRDQGGELTRDVEESLQQANGRPTAMGTEPSDSTLADATIFRWGERESESEARGRESDLGIDGSYVADTDSARLKERCRTESVEQEQRPSERSSQEVADPAGEGPPECPQPGEVAERGETTRTQRPSGGQDIGRRSSSQWAVEPNVGRVAHGVPSRVDRLRALGNAVVPQIAQWIGERILDESHHQSRR